MDMNIGELIPNSQPQLMRDVNIALLAKNLDMIKTMGDATVKMMEQSVTPHIGSNFDTTV